MSVLKKLTKQERKNLNRLLNDRPLIFWSSPTINDIRMFEPYFFTVCGEYRNYKRLLSLFYYLISWGQKNNLEEEFKVELICVPNKNDIKKEAKKLKKISSTINYVDVYDKLKILKTEIKSSETFTSNNLKFIKKLSLIHNSSLSLNFIFKEGFFSDDSIEEFYEKLH